MIEIKNLSKQFGTFKAVDNLCLTIEDGEVVGFIGANGAGKSTTIKMMTGILEPDCGDVLLNGYSIKDKRTHLKAKQQFGFVPDTPDTFLRLTGLQYLNFMCDVYNVSVNEKHEQLLQLSEEFHIKNSLNDQILNYSHGMRQKLNIIAMILCNPKIWILDEPMVGLDPEASALLKQKISDHAKGGNIVFMSTHVISIAETLCTKIIVIKEGKILFYGTTAELKSNKNKEMEQCLLELLQGESKE